MIEIEKKKKHPQNPNNTSGRKHGWRGMKVGNENQDPNQILISENQGRPTQARFSAWYPGLGSLRLLLRRAPHFSPARGRPGVGPPRPRLSLFPALFSAG